MLTAGGAAALLSLAPRGVLARPLDPAVGTSRASRLGRRQRLAHADLHNHTQMSDAVGDPGLAYQSLAAAGLDVAALTDHTVAAISPPGPSLCSFVPDPPYGQKDPCSSFLGMSAEDFVATAALADVANIPGTFTAIRGFEWSSPFLGHVNVWFTQDATDPLETGGLAPDGLAQVGLTIPVLRELMGPLLDAPGGEELIERIKASGPGTMQLFYDWLQRDPAHLLGGGADGIAGFNHPNREPAVFDSFAYDQRVRDRMVSMEIFNRRDDYLFKNYDEGMLSPLVSCLDSGWYVGLTGVTDEHGDDWGDPDGKGRAGLYLNELTRDGVFEAMTARRFFATRERGLRLDVGVNGRTRMGQTVTDTSPRLHFDIDLEWGTDRVGMPLEVQVLTSGEAVPTVVHSEQVRLPPPSQGRPLRVTATVDRARTSWVVVRIADPSRPNDDPGPAGHPCNNYAVAYASPFYLAGTQPRR